MMNGQVYDYIVSLLLVILAVVIAFGKGDFLISGYNTASEEKKATYNVPRLRLLVSSLLVVVSAGIAVAAVLDWSEAEKEYLAAAIAVLVVVYVVLSYTWARKG